MNRYTEGFSTSRWRRTVATGLLVVTAAILLATSRFPSSSFWVGLAQAGAEAALIGGLADWFAVTALFRRPLGLPIPHTAVVPSNKDRIGAGLAAFVEQNFLTRETVAGALRSIDPAHRMAAWLVTPGNARTAAEQMLSQAPCIIEFVDTRAIRALAATAVQEQLLRADLRPLLRAAAEAFVAADLHARLLDDALRAVRDFLRRKEERFNELIDARRHGFVRRTVDRGVNRAIVEGLQELILDLSAGDSVSRKRLLALVETRASTIIASDEDAQALARALTRFMENPQAQAWFAQLLMDIRGAAADNSAPIASDACATLAELLRGMGGALMADTGLREKFNSALETVALQATPLRRELAKLIADVVRNWDAQAFSDRIEAAVDGDLQFIRINGTVVGGIVGCLLHVAKTALQ
jgi:uncharacterized membrane-anchored protein YjiN (DUF445 family)